MKNRYWVMLSAFIIIVVVLPFLLDCFYEIGKHSPLITLGYSQGEILSYISSVVALIIALSALLHSLSNNEPKFIFSYDIKNKDEKEYAIIAIALDGKRDLAVKELCIVNKKKKSVSLFANEERYGYTLETGFEDKREIELSNFRGKINEAKGSGALRNLKIKLTLATGKAVYENSKEMRNFFEEVINRE